MRPDLQSCGVLLCYTRLAKLLNTLPKNLESVPASRIIQLSKVLPSRKFEVL